MWVSWMPGNFAAVSTVATELPTVPKPSSATLATAPDLPAVTFAFERVLFFAAAVACFLLFVAMVLVVDSAGVLAPCVEAGDRLVPQQIDGGDPALREGERNLPVKKRVVEAGLRSVRCGAAEVDAVQPRPVDGREAHGAGLA